MTNRLVFKKSIGNQRGVALLLVLSAITLLTMALTELAFNSRIHYKLAITSKHRLQAFYLAQSALNLSTLLLKYHKQAEQLKEQAKEQLGDIALQPIYKLMPLSSSVLRSAFSGILPDLPNFGSSGEEAGTPEEDGIPKSNLDTDVKLIDKEELEKFFNFDGDFYSEITEETNRYDLNRLHRMLTKNKNYDQRKKLLLSILKLPSFKEALEKNKVGATELVHNLSDWVDENEAINEFDDVERGSEDGLYTGKDYGAKNGKYVNLSEMRLVAGMNDNIFRLLEPFVTVYSQSDEINPCLDENEDMAKVIIYHYTHHADCASPIPYEDEERISELASDLLSGCPEPASMAQAVNSKLGLTDLQKEAESDEPSKSKTEGVIPGCAFQLQDLLTEKNDVFHIKAIGEVGETRVSLRVVINIENQSPQKWKYYYYRVE